MSNAEFEEFTRAVGTRADTAIVAETDFFNHVTVLGGDSCSMVLAALSLSVGADVTLFSAYGGEIAKFANGGSISLRGEAAAVGNFNVNQKNVSSITLTGSLDDAVRNAELLIFGGPVHKQRTYAMALAEHLADGQVICLPNARSFGAVEVAQLLRAGGCNADVTIIELNGIGYWIDEQQNAYHLTTRSHNYAAVLPASRSNIIKRLDALIPNINIMPNVMVSGFYDGSAIVDIVALCAGGPFLKSGGATVPTGGVPLEKNQNFRNLLGENHLVLVAKLWQERMDLAQKFGIRDLPECTVMVDCFAGVQDGQGVRNIPNAQNQTHLMRDGIIASLAPLVSLAKFTDADLSVTQSLITLASNFINGNLRASYRQLDNLDVAPDNLEETRNVIEQLSLGVANG